MQTTDQERRALNYYIGENWADFVKSAEQFLTEDEIESLEIKLEKEE